MKPVPPIRILLGCGIFQILGWVLLTLISRGVWTEGFSYETPNDATPTWTFVIIQGLLGLNLIGCLLYLKDKISRLVSPVILTIAILLRLIAIPGEPIHESDFYRYLWDGKTARAGINPYRFEPGALMLYEKEIKFEFRDETTGVTWRGREFTDHESELLDRLITLRDDNPTLLDRVSHPAVTTIYPPAAQWVFTLCQVGKSDSPALIKLVFAIFDIGSIFLILLILTKLNRPPIWAILYAWNPLPVKEFSNSGHYDSIAIFLLLLALLLALSYRPAIRKAILVGVVLALGTLTKYFAVLFLPVLLIYIHDQTSSRTPIAQRLLNYSKSPILWTGLLSFSAVVFLGFLPFYIWNNTGWAELFRGLSTYQEHWQFSPGLFSLIDKLLSWFRDDHFAISKSIAALLLFGTVCTLSLNKGTDIGWKCFAVMAALFVLSPTAFPWYFCWALAFVPFQNRLSWVLLSLLLPLNYLDFHTPGDTPLANLRWGGFYATQILSWGIFFVTWISESVRRHFV